MGERRNDVKDTEVKLKDKTNGKKTVNGGTDERTGDKQTRYKQVAGPD